MLLLLELVMLVGGLYAMASAKVPPFLVGGGPQQVEGFNARLLGFLLTLPWPVSFLGAMILTPMFGRAGADYASFLELAIIFGVVISAAGLARVLGNQAEPANPIEARIAQKAQAALMAAIFCVTGIAALICCPLALIYANQALQLIAEGKGGEQYRRQAKAAQAIAIAATALWGMGVIYLVFVRLVPAPV